ncbi:hypothetical protein MKW92_009602 [Papaver armeniacum]|nr:hypothetical protein MKW92_009602 [Papaver armeniacum]
MGIPTGKVRFNVRGKIFETTATTLASVSRNSMFGAMFDYEQNHQPTEVNKEYFIDRNPDCFAVFLDLLATGELYVPPHIPEKLLYRDAHYYGLLDNVRSAKWGSFVSNRLRLAHTVRGQAPGNCNAIRASPDGGCAIAHGGIVRIYDWMHEEHLPLNLDYQRVNDIGWIDADNIVMSVCQPLRSGVGGMGIFSSSTGELRHRFQIKDEEDEVQGFAAGALCFNSDSRKIFASCIKTSNEGIGLWDQVTGKQLDFFDSSDGFCFGNANKIQWLNGSNCLFVNSWFNNKLRINLLDFRDKRIVWNWFDDGQKPSSIFHLVVDAIPMVVDAIPMEESNSVCVVTKNEDLGFLDLRSNRESVRWNSFRRMKDAKNHHSKLTLHGGQLFCSLYDNISVYFGGHDRWVLTSSLERSQGGSIRDFSIGGDRLFALHSEENAFDVWETPSAPITDRCMV